MNVFKPSSFFSWKLILQEKLIYLTPLANSLPMGLNNKYVFKYII